MASSQVRNQNYNFHRHIYFWIIEKTVNLQENVNPDLLNSLREPTRITGTNISRKEQANDAIPLIAPKWLKYDRQVGLPHFAPYLIQL